MVTALARSGPVISGAEGCRRTLAPDGAKEEEFSVLQLGQTPPQAHEAALRGTAPSTTARAAFAIGAGRPGGR